MTLGRRLAEIEAALHGRALVYFGTRGADAESLLELGCLRSVFSLIAPLEAHSVNEVSLEAETWERVELDQYDLDHDRRPVIGELRRRLLGLFDRPAAVLPYRPCAFLSSAWFPRADRVLYLGMFHEAQACFEHKPWVEGQLARSGIRVVPWRYWADSEVRLIAEWAASRVLVLRSNRTDGGAGVRLLRSPAEFDDQCPPHGDGFLAAAPYLHPSVPLNINACVFGDGAVTLHGPSVQLIGVPHLTRRFFGYCGNDFATAASLEPRVLDDLEEMAVRTGAWLHQQGYRGAFGVDALLHEGLLYLTEVNPRLQGSSCLSARIDAALGRPNVFLEHAAALLGLRASPSCPLRELAAASPPLAHVIAHNTTPAPVEVDASLLSEPGFRLVPQPKTRVQDEAVAFELVERGAVTSDGASLLPLTRLRVEAALSALRPATGPSPNSRIDLG